MCPPCVEGHSLPHTMPVHAASSGCSQSASGLLTAAVGQGEPVGRSLPSWLCPEPRHLGGWAHGSHSFRSCPALRLLREGLAWPTGQTALIQDTGAAPWLPTNNRNCCTSRQARRVSRGLRRLPAKIKLCQGPECHPELPSALGPRGCQALLCQPGEVRGQLSLPLATGRQGLWGSHPELPSIPPAPNPARPTRLCCCCLHRSAQVHAPHFCLLVLPRHPHTP